jgi:hypothetical protein
MKLVMCLYSMLDMPLCLFKLAVGSYVADVTSLI